jgi:hypothetical protein
MGDENDGNQLLGKPKISFKEWMNRNVIVE